MTKLTIDGYKNKKQNKYYTLYRNIILNRIANPIYSVYTERHHILPKCCGGNDESSNIISLSAREHFLVHYILTKFVTGKSKYKIILAFHALSKYTSVNRKEKYINSRLYEAMKIEISSANSKRSLEMWADPHFREKIIEAQKTSWVNGSREEQIERMKKNSPFKNKDIHEKTIKTRTERGTNVWVTNNPMKNKEFALKVASKRSGDNHHSKKNVEYFYKLKKEDEWEKIPKGTFHKFRESKGITRSKMRKLIEGEELDIGIYIKRVDHENKKDN